MFGDMYSHPPANASPPANVSTDFPAGIFNFLGHDNFAIYASYA